MLLCHVKTMITVEDLSTTCVKQTRAERFVHCHKPTPFQTSLEHQLTHVHVCFSRLPFKSMFRLTNRHQLGKLTVYFAKRDDLTVFYTPGPSLFPQPLRRHNPSPLPVPNATNAGPSIPQRFTPHQTQSNTYAINVILRRPRTRVDKVLWV